ncbi:hypothetical protein [Myxococcus landrumensis]|uniref:Outer membrane protein beta-barrel domain-containing protein n=1 Tax=Myxococcus landrumensis TaxID=2813577 RepID=A0ABX7NE00_9BACT|nr:hypothetical protein [Myxococcus landrumus]QSQ17015.1 hypothetical protein JY572_13580 [Myxococcus landrumus]
MRALLAGVLFWAGNAGAREPTPTPETMELGIHLGMALATSDREGSSHVGPGVRVHLLRHVGPYFSAGAEAGVYAGAGSSTQVTGSGQHQYSRVEGTLGQLGAVARLGVNVNGFRPGLVAGVGLNVAGDDSTSLGFSAGMEFEAAPLEWLPLSFDMRIHKALVDDTSLYHKPMFITLGLGWRYRW